MTLDALLNALAENRTHVMLTPSGTLKVAGTPLPPALLAEVKAHKPELVVALQEARSLAATLYHSGTTETFARGLAAARTRGTLSVLDWCTAQLAITLARRWQGVDLERAA